MPQPPQPPPYQPGPPHTVWTPPPPVPPKRRTGRIVLFVVLGLGGLFCAFIGLGALVGDDPKTAAETAADAAAGAAGAPAAEADPTETTPAPITTPALASLRLEPQIIDKQCFGSAGCNVEFEVDVAAGPVVPEGSIWRVTYEVTGVEDGPLVGTFELTDGGRYDRVSESVQTTSSKAKIKVKATRIELMSS
jgi:hypothetical protein